MGRERRKRQRAELKMREKYAVGWEVATAWTHLTTAIADETCLLQPVWLSRALAEAKATSGAVPQPCAVPGLYLQLALGDLSGASGRT